LHPHNTVQLCKGTNVHNVSNKDYEDLEGTGNDPYGHGFSKSLAKLQQSVKTRQISPYRLGLNASLSLQDKRKKRRIDDPQLSTAADTCRILGTELSRCKVRAFDWREGPKIRNWIADQGLAAVSLFDSMALLQPPTSQIAEILRSCQMNTRTRCSRSYTRLQVQVVRCQQPHGCTSTTQQTPSCTKLSEIRSHNMSVPAMYIRSPSTARSVAL
jgi:hypothetical protein